MAELAESRLCNCHSADCRLGFVAVGLKGDAEVVEAVDVVERGAFARDAREGCLVQRLHGLESQFFREGTLAEDWLLFATAFDEGLGEVGLEVLRALEEIAAVHAPIFLWVLVCGCGIKGRGGPESRDLVLRVCEIGN